MTEFQVTPQAVMARLDRIHGELEQKSNWLHEVEVELELAERTYSEFVDGFELGLLSKSESSEYKLPSEALRLKLAHSEMSPNVLGRYLGLKKKRDRLDRRLRDLRVEADIQRSILSALKELA